ncbi:MAG: serine hydrolase domain-containing protein [Aestuariibacter sp.]
MASSFETLRKDKHIPGFAYAVVQDGKVSLAGGFGYADSNHTVVVTADTPFWIASVTKPFVALSFLQLQEMQKVVFDELAANTPHFTDLCEWLASTTIPFAEGLECDQPITIQHILTHQVNAPVGTQFMYNPIMYSRLSRYLEHKFGKGTDAVEGRHNYLGQHIEQHIFAPIGMTRSMASMWDRNKALVYQEMADGYQVDKNGRRTKLRRPDKHIAGGAGIVSSVADLAKFEIAVQGDEFLSKSIKQKMLQTAKYKNGESAAYGYGWYFQELNEQPLMWHSGWDPEGGYSAIYLRLPEQNIALILLANSEGLWWHNPLDTAEIEKSEFAQVLLRMLNITQ